jgi:hypothetical protein
MGTMLSFSFHDPAGGWHEVMWVKPTPRRSASKASERLGVPALVQRQP